MDLENGILAFLLVNLILAIAGAYCVRALDAILSLFSSKWKARVSRKNERFNALVDLHMKDPELVVLTGFEATVHTLRPLLYILLLSVVTFSLYWDEFIYSWFTVLPTLFVMATSSVGLFIDVIQCQKLTRILWTVKRQRMNAVAESARPKKSSRLSLPCSATAAIAVRTRFFSAHVL
jgi:hypothetical protein